MSDNFDLFQNLEGHQRQPRKTEVSKKFMAQIRKKKTPVMQSVPKMLAQSEVKIPTTVTKEKKQTKSVKDLHNQSSV
jgi:hypothetical protein